MFNDNGVVFAGNLGDDPELRFTGDGRPVANARVARTRKYTDGSGQDREDTTWLDVTLWGGLAEHFANSARKGQRWVFVGFLREEQWEAKDGTKRRKHVLEARDAAASVLWQSVTVPERQPASAGAASDVPPPELDSSNVPF